MFELLNAKKINNNENNLVDAIIAFAPWLTPLPAAALTTLSTNKFIFYELPLVGWLFAIITGLSVELLGFAIINTYFGQAAHNRKHASLKHLAKAPTQAQITKAKNRKLTQAPVIAAFVIYLLDITTINILLELAQVYFTEQGKGLAVVIAKGLLIYLSIPAGLIIAARQNFQEMRNFVAPKGKLSKPAPKVSKPAPKVSETLEQRLAKIKSLRTLRKHADLLEFVRVTPTAKLLQITGKDPKTISEWKQAANL